MRKALALALALGISAAAQQASSAATGAAAKSDALTARMTSRQVVTPRNRPWRVPRSLLDARGTFTGKLTVVGSSRRLAWRITYTDIGPSKLEIADIHLGKPGRFGQVLVRLCGPCRSGAKGTKRLTALAARSIVSGNAWVTVITNTHPNGVIRGQIRVR